MALSTENKLYVSLAVLAASIRGQLIVHWYNMTIGAETGTGDGVWLKASAEIPPHGFVRGATRPMFDSFNAAMPDRRTK